MRSEIALAVAGANKSNAEAETANATAVNQYAEAARKMAEEADKYQKRQTTSRNAWTHWLN